MAPKLFGLKGAAKTLCYAFGAGAGFLNAVTDQPLGVRRTIPLRLHGRIDTFFVPILLLLPWATGALKQQNARRYFISFFNAALTNYLLTDYNTYGRGEAATSEE